VYAASIFWSSLKMEIHHTVQQPNELINKYWTTTKA
jgi:hypothetical protein